MSSILVLAIPTPVLNSYFFHNFLPSHYFTHVFMTPRSTHKPNLLPRIFNHWFRSSQTSGIGHLSTLGLYLLTTLPKLSLSDWIIFSALWLFLASLLFSLSILSNNTAAHPNLLEIISAPFPLLYTMLILHLLGRFPCLYISKGWGIATASTLTRERSQQLVHCAFMKTLQSQAIHGTSGASPTTSFCTHLLQALECNSASLSPLHPGTLTH